MRTSPNSEGKNAYLASLPKVAQMRHLTLGQRYEIEAYTKAGFKDSQIGVQIGVHKSAISREKRRNSDQRSGLYKAELAQRKADARKGSIPKRKRFTDQIKQEVDKLLGEDYSPEQIKGHCEKTGVACVSHERIYQYIWTDKKLGGELHKHLRRQGRRYRKRGSAKDTRGLITNRIDIEERPVIVEEKSRFGDLEVDTIIGKNHKGAIVTINDRASGFLWMKKVEARTAELVKNAILDLLEPLKELLFTMTADNGKEFALHQHIADALGIDFYFAKPYHSWQRGANENLNGLVRQYIPKKSDFNDFCDQTIGNINRKINLRPRKRLGFENPTFALKKLINQEVAFTT